jgi:hypothetical protein
MAANISALHQQFIQGFQQYGSDYAPDFPEMFVHGAVYLDAGGICQLPSAKWVPAVTAVMVGMSPHVVGRLFQHYGVRPDDFKQIYYNRTWGAPGEEVPEGYNLAKGILEGFETVQLHHHPLGQELNSVVQFALLSSQLKENWAITKIQALSRAFDQGTTTPEDFFDQENTELFVNSSNVPTLPNHSVMDFISRSGLLTPEVARKKLFRHEAWETMLVDWHTLNNERWLPVFEFCIKNLAGEPRKAMIRALHSLVPNDVTDNQSVGYVYQELMDKTAEWGIDDIGHSVVMKLNYLPTVPVPNKRYIKDTHSFDDLLSAPQSILGQVVEELKDVSVEDFALAHFCAFKQIENLGYHQQDLSGFDPNRFALKVMQAYEAFSTPVGVYANVGKLEIDDMAREGAKALVSLLVREHDFDHTVFKNLQSRSVAILASAGLDKSRLPKMSYQDLGQVFGEDLGL